MKRIYVLLGLLFTGLSGFTQNSLDILNLSGRYGLPQEYSDTYSGKATEMGSFLNLTVPVKITENTIWYNSLNHFYFNVQGDEAIPATQINPMVLNGFILRTGYYRKFDNGTGIQILLAPRLMTDFNNVDSKSFQMGGVFMYEKIYNPDLAVSYGAMYNQELFGPYVVPVVNLSWKVAEKWLIKGLIPVTLKINYLASDNLTLGFSHFGLVTSYALGDPDYAGDYMERQSIDLTLFARQRISGNFYLEGRIGRTFGRGYKQFAGDQKVDFSLPLVGFGDDRVVKNVTFNDGLLIDIGLVYNILIPE
jgi:hypothetical protein